MNTNVTTFQSIEAIVFDLDGVLVDSRDLHYKALNQALETFGYRITLEEHLGKYDGLPTKRKLELLSDEKGLPLSAHNAVWRLKQERTLDLIRNTVRPVPELDLLLKSLKRALLLNLQ